MKRTIAIAFLAFALVVGGGCQGTHVAYVHEASLGVDLSFSTEGTGRFVVGFDRNTFALVPKRHTDETDANGTPVGTEAMTVTSLSDIYIEGLDEIKFNHLVATGQVAQLIVQDAAGLEMTRKAFFDRVDAPGDDDETGAADGGGQ